MNAARNVSESEVIREVKEVIRITGLKLQRINTGCFTVGEGRAKRFVKTAEAGTLDFEGYDNRGRHVGIECKRPVGGRLSDEQAARIDDINRKGGRCVCGTERERGIRAFKKKQVYIGGMEWSLTRAGFTRR